MTLPKLPPYNKEFKKVLIRFPEEEHRILKINGAYDHSINEYVRRATMFYPKMLMALREVVKAHAENDQPRINEVIGMIKAILYAAEGDTYESKSNHDHPPLLSQGPVGV